MADTADGILLPLAIDLKFITAAKDAIVTMFNEVSRIVASVETKATQAVAAQQAPLKHVTTAATAAAQSSTVAAQGATTAAAATGKAASASSAAWSKQATTLKLQITDLGTKLKILEAETAELKKQEKIQEQIRGKLAEQVKELKLRRHEEHEGGERGEAGFGSKLAGALFGGGVGKIAGAATIATGIGIAIEVGTESVLKFVEKLKEASTEAGKLSNVWDLFGKTAVAQGTTADDMLAKLRESTGGLVDKLRLAEFGSRALQSGIKGLSPDRIAELTKATVELAEANGHSAVEAVDALTHAFSRGGQQAGIMLAHITGIAPQALRLANVSPYVNRAQRDVLSMNQAILTIISQAEKLGKVPQTLEQSIARVKVLVQDMYQSFGKGLNESAGAQYLIRLMTDLVHQFGSWEKVAESAGTKVGNALGIVAAIVQNLSGTFQALGRLLDASFVAILAGANRFAEVFGNISGSTDAVTSRFREMHPAVYEVVRIVVVLDAVLSRVVDTVTKLVNSFKEIGVSSGIGALVGGIVGAFMGNPVQGAVIGAKLGAVAGIVGVLENKGPDSRSHTMRGAVPRGMQPDGSGSVLDKAIAYGAHEPEVPLNESVEDQVKRLMAGGGPLKGIMGAYAASEKEEKRKADLDKVRKQMADEEALYKRGEDTKAVHLQRMKVLEAQEKALSVAGPKDGYTPAAISEENLRADRLITREIAKTLEERQALRLKIGKAELAETQAELELRKEAELESFKGGEVQLKDHLDRMHGYAVEGLTARQQDAALDYDVARKKNAVGRKEMEDEARKTGEPARAVQEKRAQFDVKDKEAFETYRQEVTNNEKGFQKEIAALRREGSASSLEATRIYINAELKLRQDATQEELKVLEEKNRLAQDLNKVFLEQGLITADEYLAKQRNLLGDLATLQLRGVVATRNAKDQREEQTYEEGEKTPATLAKRDTNIAVNAADASKAVATFTQTLVNGLTVLGTKITETRLTEITAKYGPEQKQLAGQLQFQTKYPEQQTGAISNENLLKTLIDSRKDEAKDIRNTLAEPNISPGDRAKAIESLQQVLDAQGQYARQLREITDRTAGLGRGFESVGQGIQSNFGSKFAQNLAQSVNAGARSAQGADAFVRVFQAPMQQSGKGVVFNQKSGEVEHTSTFNDKLTSVTDKFSALVGAVDAFTASILGAKSAVAGGVGGALGGYGLGKTVQGAVTEGPLKSIGALAGGAVGAALPVAGAALGAITGIITGMKNAAVTKHINSLNSTFRDINQAFAENTNNLNATIQSIQGLLNQARQLQASSKKGSAAYQQVIDQYIQQLNSLNVQQQQSMRDLNEQLAVLQAPQGTSQYLTGLQSIIEKYQKFEGAAQNTYDLAKANQYLTESLKDYETNLSQQLLQDNTQAINDALQLNDLLFQRSQMMLDYGQQVQQLMGQGILTRQLTRAQSVGQQVQSLSLTYHRNLEQINQQISSAQFRVKSEEQIFSLAQTRIGLENQLIAAQSEQTKLDMLRIAELQVVVNQIASGDLSTGAVGALLRSLQTVSNPAAGVYGNQSILDVLAGVVSTDYTGGANLLTALSGAGYQSRSSLGYAPFRDSNF